MRQPHLNILRRERRPGALACWCEAAGLRPAPRTIAALARGVSLPGETVWRAVSGSGSPSLRTLRVLSRELRIGMEAVARACEQAQELEQRRRAVDLARLTAERC